MEPLTRLIAGCSSFVSCGRPSTDALELARPRIDHGVRADRVT
jgi:hypothetical protein